MYKNTDNDILKVELEECTCILKKRITAKPSILITIANHPAIENGWSMVDMALEGIFLLYKTVNVS